MVDDLQTDEYGISISREITVCRNMIERQRKHLIRFEKQYGFFTEEVIKKENLKIETTTRDIDQWRNEYEGLLAWQQRLREYEKAYEALKR
ncbi:MAG: hypothetical protein Q8R42_04535 [Desulfocapsaceae bacterium]|nr:hypothetical protein [Desulfocapsaceae bacterium]MDP3695358.1 hypothetical protein [Desulfocapsaceae bacterium]